MKVRKRNQHAYEPGEVQPQEQPQAAADEHRVNGGHQELAPDEGDEIPVDFLEDADGHLLGGAIPDGQVVRPFLGDALGLREQEKQVDGDDDRVEQHPDPAQEAARGPEEEFPRTSQEGRGLLAQLGQLLLEPVLQVAGVQLAVAVEVARRGSLRAGGVDGYGGGARRGGHRQRGGRRGGGRTCCILSRLRPVEPASAVKRSCAWWAKAGRSWTMRAEER